ncbi:hypothetical protein HDU97_006715 [Phlyctochytrium planicorne]|nr:hypothetical protein HDU97_006715 [Phlyctochytrium planicorne]
MATVKALDDNRMPTANPSNETLQEIDPDNAAQQEKHSSTEMAKDNTNPSFLMSTDSRIEDNAPEELEEDEIYDMVDAVVPRGDDPSLPVLTFRVILLGGFFGLIMCILNVLFSFRTNVFSTNSIIGALISYPLGLAMEKVLPKGILNPGPFNYKEHTMIYVICSCMAGPAYALYNIVGQKYQLYQENLTDGAAIFFAINTQVIGYGLAGLCRRFLVRPAAMIWPNSLSVVAMLNSLHEKPVTTTDGYSSSNRGLLSLHRSRYSHFWLITLICGLWQIFPAFVAPVLSAVSLLCYIAPATRDPQLTRVLGSAYNGYGLLSLSFDWNVIGTMAPITTPLWALLNQMLGSYAVNTPGLFDKDGHPISPQNFVKLPNLVLDEEFYESKKPIYITTMFAVEYLASFIVFVAAIMHVALWYSKDIIQRFRTAMRDLDAKDIHARLMDVYDDVPEWWFMAVLGINMVVTILVCQFGGFDLPWWGVLLGLALALVSILPLGIILAISGQLIGLNVMSEFLIGLILPGRAAAVMSFKTLSYMAMSQGLFLVGDLKLGHYMKIPPRIMFWAQLVSTIVAAVVNVFAAKAIYESFGKVCVENDAGTGTTCGIWKIQTPDAPLGWTATNYNVFIRAGAIWGAIGPARFFGKGSPYQYTLIGFAIGATLPLIPWALLKAFPKMTWLKLINIPLIAVFPTEVGSARSDMITPLIIGIFFNYYLRRYRHAWWKKYAYVTSAALDSGLAITLTIIFMCFTLGIGAKTESEASRIFPFWALNPYDGEYCAPSFYLTCSENSRWGNSWGKSYYMIQEQDPYCTSINFQNQSVSERERAMADGVLKA